MLGSWLLHFIVYAIIDEDPVVYVTKEIVQGILFILVVTPIYFVIVNLFYKGKRKIVLIILTSLGVLSIAIIFIDYFLGSSH
ncbi:hypothetical protein [Guptibacillus hwajinpoensis]|uniref:hypothetical protein n=2 Tax=Guptibacillus hwajinpoensis TaxID=208199 RepID=UPI003734DFDF